MSSRFATSSFHSAMAGLATVFATFVSGVIVANLLGTEGAGVLAFAVWMALIVAQVIDGGTSLNVCRFLPDLNVRDPAAAHALSGWLVRRLLINHALTTAVLILFYLFDAQVVLSATRVLTGDLTAPMVFVLLFGGLVLTQSLAAYGTACLRGSQNFGALAALTSVSMVGQIAGVYLGAKLYGTTGAIAGYVAGQVILAAFAIRFIRRVGAVSPEIKCETRRYGRYAWAATICSAFVWSRIEFLFLQTYRDIEEVGLFSVALALAALASQGPLLLTGAFLPMLAEKQGQGDRSGLQTAFSSGTRLLAMLAFPACFGMIAILPQLVGFLYGPAFSDAVPAAMIMVMVAAFSISTVVGSHLVNALSRSDFVFWASLIGAAVSITLGYLLIPDFGILGAAISRAGTQFLVLGLGMWFLTKRLGFEYPIGPMFRTLLAALVSALAGFLIALMLGDIFGILAAILISGFVYIVCLRVFRAVQPEDISNIKRLTSELPAPCARLVNVLLAFVDPQSEDQQPRKHAV